MSTKRSKQAPEVLFEDVVEAMAAIEKDHHVHVHYVIRRPANRTSKNNARVVLFARNVGIGGEGRTICTEECSFPTSDGISLSSLLLMLANALYLRIGEKRALQAAKQLPLTDWPDWLVSA